ncbi:MAG TPA: DUF4304 domain-containing protein [Rhizomicrobium sp.]|jgi:hypothetical protein
MEAALPRETDHSRMIAAAARHALTPLGFWRKGKSRIWLADRGFWLVVIEFQPSGFSKGSYLNVSAHWIWGATPNSLSFDYIIMNKKPWIEFKDVEQFAPQIERLAQQAAIETHRLETQIGNIRSAAKILLAMEETSSSENRGGGWLAFNAAVAAGASGDLASARIFMTKAYDSLVAWRADMQPLLVPYLSALDDEETFVKFVRDRIDERRAELGLGPNRAAKS